MRLDWFLPYLRKSSPDRPDRVHGVVSRLARSLLPPSLFSSRQTKQRGRIRRFLRALGPIWYSSPLRRLIQSVCFLLFLWLFFVTCWPYSASPAPVSSGWIPAELDLEAGTVLLISDSSADFSLQIGDQVFVRDESATDFGPALSTAFAVADVRPKQLQLIASDATDAGVFDELSLSLATWSLHTSDPTAWPDHFARNLQQKEFVDAEVFLAIDPLVSLSTAVASRSWVWSLVSAGVILAVCILIPRGFCGYLCPLGTLIDLFDWLIGSRVTSLRVSGDGWWVHIRYYLLLGVMVAALSGVLLSGFVAAIPVITRGLQFTLAPIQNGAANGWHQMPHVGWGHVLSIVLFLAVPGLGFFRPRFWCKYVCPSGAVFSLGNLFRISERKVETSCINCNKCVEVCPFDAIKPDFTTRTTDCTLCQTCGGVCPTHAIKFVGRWEVQGLKIENDPPTNETPIGRRGFVAAAIGISTAVTGGLAAATGTRALGARLDDPNSVRPVRPPGSVPEQEFLQMCIRCGECFKACPSDVLQPLGFQQGLEGLWTPHVVADWAGCASSCNACGEVCPTGAIRAIPLEEKRHARMGLAIINQSTCLPIAGKEPCQLCVDECHAAGYDAIEFVRVGTSVDEFGQPIEGTGMLAPLMIDDKCVGCGLCQTRCYGINVAEKGLLTESAVVIKAGGNHEDRLMTGSYVELRNSSQPRADGAAESTEYLPEFLK